MAWQALFGSKLRNHGGATVDTEAALSGKAVGVYFSAHWCPPCRMFTPQLMSTYKTITGAGKNFEVVFVSSDRSKHEFDEYHDSMPWLAVPYEEESLRSKLSGKFKVRGIPTFVMLGEDGSVITLDGRAKVSGDPSGARFPWRPPTFTECLGSELLAPDGSRVPVASLAGKTIGLYFSAHWCGPCRAFTPQLADKYRKWVKEGALADKFEIVFVSSDRDERSFDEYRGDMPWLALPYANRMGKEELSSRFGVEGIPSLIIVQSDGTVINKDGREAIDGDSTGADFPWKPAPANDINVNPSGINESPALIALLAPLGAAEQESAIAALRKVGAELRAEEDEVIVLYERSVDRISQQVRGLLRLKAEDEASPQLVLLNLGAGAFFRSDASEVNEDTVRAFLAAFKADALEPHPLR